MRRFGNTWFWKSVSSAETSAEGERVRGLRVVMLAVCWAVVLGWLTTLPALADPTGNPGSVLYVSPNGTSQTCDRQENAAIPPSTPASYSYNFCTLEDALELAEDGDVLWLRADQGPYGTVEISKSVTLVGGFTVFPTTVGENPAQADADSYSVFSTGLEEPAVVIKNITNTVTVNVRLERIQVEHTSGALGPGILARGPISPTDYITDTVPITAQLPITNVPIGLTLAGVLVRDNQAPASAEEENGGGVQIFADTLADITVVSDHLGPATFANNRAANGGALFIPPGSTLTLDGCAFTGNEATNGSGGAIYVVEQDTFALENCTFQENLATQTGGAVFARDLGPWTLASATFTANEAASGGAVYAAQTGNSTFSTLGFSENVASAGDGGALFVDGMGTGTWSNLNFGGNLARGIGLRGNGASAYLSGTAGINVNTITVTGLRTPTEDDPDVETSATNRGGGFFMRNSAGLAVSGACTFNNHTTTGDGGVFYLENVDSVAFTGCTFDANRSVTGSGGAVYATGGASATFTNVNFTQNLADVGLGGGLYVAADAVTISGGTQTDNAAASGGVIYVDAASTTVAVSAPNGTVQRNAAIGADAAGLGVGGAYVLGGAQVTLSNATFVTNTATGTGGGVVISGTQTANLSGNVFTNNYAAARGGALALVNSPGVTIDTITLNNHRTGGDGGALYATNSQITSTAAISLTQNRAQNNGGAAYLTNASRLASVGLALDYNSAVTGHGGGIYAAIGSDVVISGATNVVSNTAQAGDGGGIYLGTGSDFSAGTAYFGWNRAHNHGGAVYATGGLVQLASAHFERQTTQQGRGGAVYFAAVGTLDVDGDLRVEHNSAHTDGGGLYGGINIVVGQATTIFSNTARTGSGGGTLLTGGGLSVGGTLTVEDNQAALNGGGLGASVANISVTGATLVTNNRALGGDGGGLYFNGTVVGTFSSGVTLTSNRAQKSGGGLYGLANTLNFLQVATIAQNQAVDLDGGGVYLANGGQVNFFQLQAANNQARRSGGGVYANEVGLVVGGGSVIHANRALEADGGGFYLAQEAASFPGKVTITSNEARRNGGGVYADGSDITMGNASDVSGNKAAFPDGPGNGGGLYIAGGESLFDNVTIKNNTTRDDGGGLYVGPNGVVTARNGVDIDGNTVALGRGGGIFAGAGGVVNLDSMFLRNNTAQQSGGGVFVSEGEVRGANNTQITANRTISGQGGGVAVITGSIAFTNSVVSNNQALLNGGGIYNLGGSVAGRNTQVTGNQATTLQGGGIFVSAGVRVELLSMTVTGNQAATGGGGIHAAALTVILRDSTLRQNNGGAGAGGGIFVQSDVARVQRNTIEENQTAGDGGGLSFAQTGQIELGENSIARNIIRRDVTVLSVTLTEDAPVPTGIDPSQVPKAGETVSRQEVSQGVGAGLHLLSSTGTFTNNTFLRNENQAGNGGGLYLRAGDVTMLNNLVVQNRLAVTQVYGSGIYIAGNKTTLIHTTIADNLNTNPDPDALGVGIFSTRTATDTSGSSILANVTMINNIVAGHDVGMLTMAGATVGMTSTVWSNGEENWNGPGVVEPSVGNVTGDPQFVDAANGDYRIRRTSAAFDIGVPTAVQTDIIGTPRLRAFGVDAGAYEQFYSQGLHMRVTADPAFVNSGDVLEYAVEIVNHSPVALNNVQLNVTLPSQQTLVSSSCGGLSCNLGTFQPEQRATITLRATASGTPPAQGFIEMLTGFSLSAGNLGTNSDRTESFTSRIQRCRIVYNNVDYGTIQAAIDAVNDGDDIPDIVRVAGYCGGTVDVYKELTLQGGWNTSFTTRDFAQFPTTIDVAGQGRGIEVRNQIAPVIENFVIRGGSAGGKGGGYGGKDAGGGIYVRDAYATFRNIQIINARAALGGGIYVNQLVEPTFENVVVEGSNADAGGGLFAYKSAPKFINSTFRNNTAAGGGGAYFLQASGASFAGSTFLNNRATGTARYIDLAFFNLRFTNGGGGGMNLDESQVSVNSSRFEGNSAKAGGAIFADNSPGSVGSSVFHNNSASSDASTVPVLILANTGGGGGAIYMQRSNMSVQGNRFTNNSASGRGGSIHIFNVNGDGAISGNFFGFNNASGGGSAIYAHLRPDKSRFFVLPLLDIPDQLIPLILGLEDEPAAIRMDHNTFAHNQGGSTILFYGEGRGFMVNNIIALNSGTAVRAESEILPFILLVAPIPFIGVLPIPYVVPYIPIINTDTTLWYPNVSAGGSLGGRVNQTANVVGNPHFKNDGYHIKRISAAFGAGKNSGAGPDLDGEARPAGSFSDIGADEYVPATTVRYVAPTGGDTGGGFCRNYLNPCSNLQVAIDAALDGDIIKMAGGTYSGGHMTRDGQVQMGYITKTVTIQGGYYPFTTNNSVTEGNFTEHDWEVPFPDINPTILDAQNGGRVLYIFDPGRVDQDGNPIEVRPIISGIRMRNGNAAGLRGPDANTFPAGGAVYVDRSKAVLNDVLISGSTADYGGGLYILESEVGLTDVRLENNRANHRGGGLYLDNSDDLIFQGMLIENNVAPRGGGAYFFQSDAYLELNQLRNNGGPNTVAGGGLYLEASATNVISHTILGNQANMGGGVFVDGGDPQFVGNTVSNNTAFPTNPRGRGGGFYFAAAGGQMTRNVISQNQADDGGGIYLDQAGVQVIDNQIEANVATRAGGGVYFLSTTDARVAENRLVQNRANGTGENDGGGGLYYDSSTAASAQNEIRSNTAFAGGGAYLFSFSNAPLEENIIAANSANGDGGGVYIKLSNASLTGNTIEGNSTVVGSGGGVYVKLSGARLTENTVRANRATLFGGGVYLDESGASLRMGTVEENQARDGGGIYIFRSNTATFDTVGIRGNRAENNGGGVFIRLSDVPFEGQVIEDNVAGLLGGGAFLDESNSRFGRNLVRGNEAGERGGGVAIINRSNASLASNAIIDNQAGATGSGVFVGGASPTLIHSTLARNRGGDGTGVAAEARSGVASSVSLINTIFAGQDLGVRASAGNTVTLEATLWDNSVQTRFTPGQGIILPGPADLNFAGAANFEADGYHIQRTSLAIGVGVFTEVSRDIDGQGRPQGGAPDLGADELPAECLAVVSTNLDLVYTEVQEAINAADPGAEVRIAGTCTGVRNQGGTRQLAYVNKNITLRGGYTPTNWIVSYPITQPTFLDGLGDGRVIFVAQNVNPTIEDLNLLNGSASGLGGGPSALDAGGVIYVRNASPTLRRLTVGGGEAYYGGGLYLQNSQSTVTDNQFDGHNGTKGGALFLRNSTATLRNNLIRAGAAEDGGGVFLSFSQPLLENNQIIENSATAAGGGLFLESSPATLRANVVATNTAEAAGGIYVDGSTPQLVRNRFSANEAQNGGGVYLLGTNGTVNGNVILSNSAGVGGGVYIQGGEPNFANNVVAQNQAQVQAAGIYVLSASFPMRHNTIVANGGADGAGLFVSDLGINPSQIDFINNILAEHTVGITLTAGNRINVIHTLYHQNGSNFGGQGQVQEGAGNFSAPPQFVDAVGGDYHLAGTSPAVDAGIDAGIGEDFDGQSRPADNGFDVGADEFVVMGLRITVQTIPDPVVAGQDATFVIRAVNRGNVELNATIVAQLPDAVIPSGLFTFTAVIPPGEAWTESILARVRPDFSGALEIIVTATTEDGLSEVVTVMAAAERPDYAVQLTVEPVPNPAPKGGQLRYRINLANAGNLAVNPTLRAQLSPQVSYSGPLEWSAAQLTPGSAWARAIDVVVSPNATGTLTATFTATSPEGATATATVNVPVAEPGLIVERYLSPNPPVAGSVFTYTVFITNTGNVDFTTTITNNMPTDPDGRPVVAPSGPIIFADLVIPRGQTVIRQIVGVLEPGYAGPLVGSTIARTDSGLIFVATDDGVNSVLPDITPTKVAIRDGRWDDPSIWDPAGVPTAGDIVLIPEGRVVRVDGARLNPVVLAGLINRGDILVDCVADVPVVFEVSGTLENAGRILGADGRLPGQPGCALEIDVGTLHNTGLIRGGNGADGDGSVPLNGGDGGGVIVRGQIAVNDGQIIGGNGGNVPPPTGEANGGAGGNVFVFAGPEDPGLLINRGLIRAGNGGSGFNGGRGGDMALLATSLLIIDGGEQLAGRGGAGDLDNGGSNGEDGSAIIAGATIWNNGDVTQASEGFAFSILGPASRVLAPGARVLVPFIFLNRGINNDAYSLIWSNSAQWRLENLPGTLNVSALRFGVLLVDTRLPRDVSVGDSTILRLSARSQGNPRLAVDRAVRLRIGGATTLLLPVVGNDTQLEPTPPAPVDPPPVSTQDKRIYLSTLHR